MPGPASRSSDSPARPVYASMACVSASSPVAAVMRGGRPTMSVGSRIARSGATSRVEDVRLGPHVFCVLDDRHVGHFAACPRRGRDGDVHVVGAPGKWYMPIDSMARQSLASATAVAFAVSRMQLPPPRLMMTSAFDERAIATAASTTPMLPKSCVHGVEHPDDARTEHLAQARQGPACDHALVGDDERALPCPCLASSARSQAREAARDPRAGLRARLVLVRQRAAASHEHAVSRLRVRIRFDPDMANVLHLGVLGQARSAPSRARCPLCLYPPKGARSWKKCQSLIQTVPGYACGRRRGGARSRSRDHTPPARPKSESFAISMASSSSR